MRIRVNFGHKRDAVFNRADDAQQFAQWISTLRSNSVEVHLLTGSGRGIIGQYVKGEPTPEFQGRGDEWYPAGPRHRGFFERQAAKLKGGGCKS